MACQPIPDNGATEISSRSSDPVVIRVAVLPSVRSTGEPSTAATHDGGASLGAAGTARTPAALPFVGDAVIGGDPPSRPDLDHSRRLERLRPPHGPDFAGMTAVTSMEIRRWRSQGDAHRTQDRYHGNEQLASQCKFCSPAALRRPEQHRRRRHAGPGRCCNRVWSLMHANIISDFHACMIGKVSHGRSPVRRTVTGRSIEGESYSPPEDQAYHRVCGIRFRRSHESSRM